MRIPRRHLVAVGVLALAALYAAWRMQVASWDLRNYHLYGPWAWLAGRLDSDVAVAQVQTFYNPMLFLWLPWAAQHMPGVLLAAALGAVQGTNALLLHSIARHALGPGTPRWLPVLVAATGATAATQLAELGATSGDNLVSIPILAAIALLVHPRVRNGIAPAIAFAAGALLGLAAGLKLAVAPCALGAFVAAACMPAASRMRHLGALAAGAALAFALAAGPWAVVQYRLRGDPLFPLLSSWLGAPLAFSPPPRELRFLPHGATDWLLRPFAALFDWSRVSDLEFRDTRLPLLCTAFVATFGLRANRRRATWPWLAGTAVAYASWLALSGYQRYVLPLELLAPLGVALLWPWRATSYGRAALAGVFVATIAATDPPDIGRLVSRARPVYEVALPGNVPVAGATVLVAGEDPLAFVALALPADARVLRLQSNFHGGRPGSGAFDAWVAREAARPAARYAALFQALTPAAAPARFGASGFEVATESCGRVESPLVPLHEPPAWLCVARRR